MSDNATLVKRLSSTTHVGFELDDLCDEAAARIAELEAALKPFSDAVFYDNGDVTIDTSRLNTKEYLRAYSAIRARPAP